MMNDSLTIKIDILQRPYTVKIKKQDEAIFRQASRSIEESVQKYATKNAIYRDKQDLLAMALLESTVSNLKNKYTEENMTLTNQTFKLVNELNVILSSNLN